MYASIADVTIFLTSEGLSKDVRVNKLLLYDGPFSMNWNSV